MNERRRLADLLGAIVLANTVVTLQWIKSNPATGRQDSVAPKETAVLKADEADGRDASTPSDIPARGWWKIVRRTISQVSANELLAQAAGVTFYGILSIFPAIAATVSLYGLIADPKTISEHLDTLGGFVPGGGMEIITDQVKRLTQNPTDKLGFGLLFGVATAIWSANQGSKALLSALNVVYGEKEKRGFFSLTSTSLAFTLGAVVFVLLALSAVVILPLALEFIGLGKGADELLRIGRWPAILIVIAAFLACLYRFGPSRATARWRWVTWGSAFASVSWLVLSGGFSWYVEHFGSYNKTYGSLGAAVGFMTWIWLSTTVMLVGAQLNAEAEHQTGRDTTTGDPKSLGTRGARKADTVA